MALSGRILVMTTVLVVVLVVVVATADIVVAKISTIT